MANISFGKGTLALTKTTSEFVDGMIYFNTSDHSIRLNNNGTAVIYKGTDENVTVSSTVNQKFYLSGVGTRDTTGKLLACDKVFMGDDNCLYSNSNKCATIKTARVSNSIHGHYYDGNFDESSSPKSEYPTGNNYADFLAMYSAAYEMWCNNVSIAQIQATGGTHTMQVIDVGPAYLQSAVGVNPPTYYGLEIYIRCEGYLYEYQICSALLTLTEAPSPEALHGQTLMIQITRYDP